MHIYAVAKAGRFLDFRCRFAARSPVSRPYSVRWCDPLCSRGTALLKSWMYKRAHITNTRILCHVFTIASRNTNEHNLLPIDLGYRNIHGKWPALIGVRAKLSGRRTMMLNRGTSCWTEGSTWAWLGGTPLELKMSRPVEPGRRTEQIFRSRGLMSIFFHSALEGTSME